MRINVAGKKSSILAVLSRKAVLCFMGSLAGYMMISGCWPPPPNAKGHAPMTLSKPPMLDVDPDISWADAFVLPGCGQRFEGVRLNIAYPIPLIDGRMAMSASGEQAMKELTSLVRQSNIPLEVEVIVSGIGVEGAAERITEGTRRALVISGYLVAQGLPADTVTARGTDLDPDDLNRSQVVRIVIQRAAVAP